MDILLHALNGGVKVLVVGIILGAGLPAVFALGMWSLDRGEANAAEGTFKPSPAGIAGAAICFTIVAAAVLMGILLIMATVIKHHTGVDVLFWK